MRNYNPLIVIIVFLSGLLFNCNTANKQAKLELIPIFGDNMVLQQGQKIPVWGISNPEATVIVKFRDKELEVKADNLGKWKVYFENLEPGNPDSMIVICDTITKVFKNVLVGEVWLCSGQSNMEMNVDCKWATAKNAAEEVANANYPDIRLFIVDHNITVNPVDTIDSKGWKVCSPETVGDFSAAGYFFGREIHTTQKVPVGLIQSAWGGTVAEAWTSGESLKLMKDFAGQVDMVGSLPVNKDSLQAKYERDFQAWLLETAEADAGINGSDSIFASPDLDDKDWMKIKVPGMWEGTEIGALDGVVWFRKKVSVPASQVGKKFKISIAPPDDAEETWVNGVKVGASAVWDVVRHYDIPDNVIKAGENIVVVRLSDFQGDGGFMGKPDDMSLYTEDGWKTTFSGEWLCKVGFNNNQIKIKPFKPGNPNVPTLLYNAMIHPIQTYGIRGVIWYQGESNSGMAYQYRELFKTMITDWRKQWEQGDFPFLFVQLANYQPRNTEPIEHPWAELREAQLMALSLPNTGMAVTIDIGDAKDIHPSNKQDVGKRLAFIARNKVYKEDVPYSGPIYKNMIIDGNRIVLEFDYVYDGLSKSDSRNLTGFSIAGEDKVFHWAKAEIIDNKVIVSCPKVAEPKSVRYAWSNNPDCNLTNSTGIPASPFRTDDWPGLTVPDELRN